MIVLLVGFVVYWLARLLVVICLYDKFCGLLYFVGYFVSYVFACFGDCCCGFWLFDVAVIICVV